MERLFNGNICEKLIPCLLGQMHLTMMKYSYIQNQKQIQLHNYHDPTYMKPARMRANLTRMRIGRNTESGVVIESKINPEIILCVLFYVELY